MKLCELDIFMQTLLSGSTFSNESYRTIYCSAEYKKAIAPFLQLAASLESEIAEYPADRRAEAFREAQRAVVRTEYGKGGTLLPLGFYGPDPVEDFMVCGIHRGKILKRMTSRTKPDWIYGFDANETLRTLILLPDAEIGITAKTVLVDRSDQMMCLKFNEHDSRFTESETICFQTDTGRLVRMIRIAPPIAGRVTHVEIYDYSYTSLGIDERVCTKIFTGSAPQLPFLPALPPTVHRTAVRFVHDEAGRVSGYYTSWSDGQRVEAAVPTEIPPEDRRFL